MGSKEGTGERLTWKPEEVAKKLGIGRNLAYQAIERGEIPSVKVGRRVLVPRKALEEMLSKPVKPVDE